METPVSVAIVEDEKDSAIKLKKYLEKYAEENALKVETAAFSCGENFLSSKKKFDVVFMDIEMPGDDGLKVVKTLRSEGSDVLVVFCTNLAQYAVNGYEVAAFDFMVKPVTYFEFRMKFDRVINCLNSRKKREVWVASRQGKRLVSEKRLKYVEIMRHTLVYHTLDGNVTGTGTLKSVTEIFSSPSFALCNQCYFVNLAFVTEINGNFVYVDGDALAISAPKKKEFLRALNTFLASGGGR